MLVRSVEYMGTEGNRSLLSEHIENRRLFNLASGVIKFFEWEQEHLHTCNLCQGVLHVFVRQPGDALAGGDERPANDAA